MVISKMKMQKAIWRTLKACVNEENDAPHVSLKMENMKKQSEKK